jgi:hypothetical protein
LQPTIQERVFKQPHRRIGDSQPVQSCSAYPIRSVDSEAAMHCDVEILE